MRPHPKRARTDPSDPRAWATDDLSGFICNHKDLVWVHQWGGTQLINQGMLTHPDFLDKPQEQLRTIILPADPESVMNARPEPYSIDEQTARVEMDGQQRVEEDGDERLQSNLQSGNEEQ